MVREGTHRKAFLLLLLLLSFMLDNDGDICIYDIEMDVWNNCFSVDISMTKENRKNMHYLKGKCGCGIIFHHTFVHLAITSM